MRLPRRRGQLAKAGRIAARPAGSPRQPAGRRPATAHGSRRTTVSGRSAAQSTTAPSTESTVRAGKAAAPEQPRRARRASLTSRAAILAVVVCAVVLTLAYPLRTYLAQRGQIASLHQQVATQLHQVASLQAQQQKWSDPAYVKAQAERRLHYVTPGQRVDIPLAPLQASPAPSTRPVHAVVPVPTSGAWYVKLWTSTVQAGRSR